MAKAITTTSNLTTAAIPDYLKPIIGAGIGQLGEAQGAFPTLAQIPGETPILNVPNLTPEQQALIDQITQAGATSPDLQAARAQLEQLTSGAIGSSPATQAALQAYQQFQAPRLLQQAALAGRGTGGAALEATALGGEQAMVPLLQQEIQNRAAAVGQYGNLQQQQLQSLATAFQAQGYPREVALQQAQAAFDQAQQKLAFQEMIQTLPLQLIPRLIGTQQQGRQEGHQTKTAEDWISGGLAAAGSVLGAFGF